METMQRDIDAVREGAKEGVGAESPATREGWEEVGEMMALERIRCCYYLASSEGIDAVMDDILFRK